MRGWTNEEIDMQNLPKLQQKGSGCSNAPGCRAFQRSHLSWGRREGKCETQQSLTLLNLNESKTISIEAHRSAWDARGPIRAGGTGEADAGRARQAGRSRNGACTYTK